MPLDSPPERRAKRPVEWFRKLWSLPRQLVLRVALYALVATAGVGLGLPSLLKGETTFLFLWLLGPLAVMLFSGLNDFGGEQPPEQRHNEAAQNAVHPDTLMATGFGALLFLSFALGVRDFLEMQSYTPFYLLVPTFAVLLTLIGGGFLLRPVLAARAAELGVDESGVRVHRKGAPAYWPFELLASARIHKRGFLPWLVLRDRTGRAVVELPLLGKSAEERGRQIAEEIEHGIASAKASAEPPHELRRGDRPMRDWLEDVRQLIASERAKAYRARLSEETVLATLDDPAAPVDARAAAAHALLTEGSPRVRVEVRQRIGPASPPLVQLATRVSQEGCDLVSDADLEEALASLDSLDREEAVALLDEAGIART